MRQDVMKGLYVKLDDITNFLDVATHFHIVLQQCEIIATT